MRRRVRSWGSALTSGHQMWEPLWTGRKDRVVHSFTSSKARRQVGTPSRTSSHPAYARLVGTVVAALQMEEICASVIRSGASESAISKHHV